MNSIGSSLREKREAEGLSLEEVAGRLCITSSYLRALEADDVDSLPGTFFYRSFALQYAGLLGLDRDAIRADVDSVSGHRDESVPRIEPTLQIASRHGWARRRLVMGTGLALAVCAAAGLSVTMSVMRMGPSTQASSPSPLVLTTPAEAPAEVETFVPAEPGDAVVTEPTPSPETTVLNVAARETTWLSITSGGRAIFEGILWPRESKTLTGLDVARMKVGNAGGLDVSWHGKPVGPIGETGQVRIVVFSEDDVQVLPPERSL
jgi:cytoskeletal protein RodZ